eukprot:801574-Alexandrium_andersonii.AAC.1
MKHWSDPCMFVHHTVATMQCPGVTGKPDTSRAIDDSVAHWIPKEVAVTTKRHATTELCSLITLCSKQSESGMVWTMCFSDVAMLAIPSAETHDRSVFVENCTWWLPGVPCAKWPLQTACLRAHVRVSVLVSVSVPVFVPVSVPACACICARTKCCIVCVLSLAKCRECCMLLQVAWATHVASTIRTHHMHVCQPTC